MEKAHDAARAKRPIGVCAAMPDGSQDEVIGILYLTVGLAVVAILAVAYLLYRWLTYDPTARPDWARFLTDQQWQVLTGHVTAHFEARGRDARISDGMVVAGGPDERTHEYGLTNLAQMCRQAEPDEWPAIVNSHFSAMSQGLQASDEIGVPLESPAADARKDSS